MSGSASDLVFITVCSCKPTNSRMRNSGRGFWEWRWGETELCYSPHSSILPPLRSSWPPQPASDWSGRKSRKTQRLWRKWRGSVLQWPPPAIGDVGGREYKQMTRSTKEPKQNLVSSDWEFKFTVRGLCSRSCHKNNNSGPRSRSVVYIHDILAMYIFLLLIWEIELLQTIKQRSKQSGKVAPPGDMRGREAELTK